jgi:hypothetical protein
VRRTYVIRVSAGRLRGLLEPFRGLPDGAVVEICATPSTGELTASSPAGATPGVARPLPSGRAIETVTVRTEAL